ncbi:MAG: hypothetical protein R2684_12980 [Pyrinomonadaceae bacterium]
MSNATIRREIGIDAVNRTKQKTTDDKKGKFHEEGGAVYDTKDGQIAVPAKPGPVGEPGKSGGAGINVFDAADPSLMEQVTDTTPLTTYHTHPGGTEESVRMVGGQTAIIVKSFEQTPSNGIDIPNAANRSTRLGYNIVVGAGSKMKGTTINNKSSNGGQRVYFCNGTGVIGSMAIDGFVKAGRR